MGFPWHVCRALKYTIKGNFWPYHISISQKWKAWLRFTSVGGRKWKWSRSVVSDSLWPYGLYSPWNSPGQNTGVGSLSLLQGDLPNPGIEPRSPTLQADSLPAEPQGKPSCCWNPSKEPIQDSPEVRWRVGLDIPNDCKHLLTPRWGS